jgi:hypothetical protein
MVDLNTLIAPDSPYIVTSATGINDAGQIVGYGYVLPQYDIHAFLLTPDASLGSSGRLEIGPLAVPTLAPVPQTDVRLTLFTTDRPTIYGQQEREELVNQGELTPRTTAAPAAAARPVYESNIAWSSNFGIDLLALNLSVWR